MLKQNVGREIMLSFFWEGTILKKSESFLVTKLECHLYLDVNLDWLHLF